MTQIFVNGKGATFGIPDDTVVVQNGGIWEFYGPGTPAKTVQGPTGPINYPAVRGPKLNLPTDLTPYAPTAAEQLAAAQQTQIETISAGCAATIVSGFTSSALGAAYTYPSKEGGENRDQTNLIGAYGNSLNPANASTWTTKFWCCDASGSWAFRAHTAAQIQQVFSDGAARKIACIEQNAALSAQVMAAADVASVQAIVWVAP